MKSSDFWIGIVILVMGGINLLIHLLKPTLFRKLAVMKEKFGDKAGFIIHLIFYVIIPLIVGTILLFGYV